MAKFNLVESFFDRRHGFETAVLCSYGLDLHFFENYLLKLNGLYACDDIALFVDAQTYAQFQQSGYIPQALNRRYLVSWLQSPGVFHTKLYLLASPKKALIGIGSANLTREGIASNLELLATFEVSERDQTYAPLLGECIAYVQRLAQLTQSQRAQDQVAALADCCRPLVHVQGEIPASQLQFLHNLDRPLWDEMVAALNGRSVNKIQIISPFFDSQLEPLHMIQLQWPDCQTEIYIQQHKSTFPLAQFDSTYGVHVYHDIDRYLHGKAILLHTPTQIYLFMGSANFTSSALLSPAHEGNFEAGLIGSIDAETAESILHPIGQTAVLVTNPAEIQVNSLTPFPERKSSYIPYLIEATLTKDIVQIETNPAVSPAQFHPVRYRLVDFHENSFEGSLSKPTTVSLPAKVRKKMQGRFGLQFIGKDEQGEERLSNLVWVIDWDERSGDRYGRLLRRIHSDPSELFHVLEEIIATGDERELMLFLQRFDIPLDLLLPPRLGHGPRSVKSKGNLVGTLPFHLGKFFSNNMLAAYEACLDRLLAKLKKHLTDPQPDKIGNFVLIFNSFLVLLDFVNSWANQKYSEKRIITSDDWLLIRNCYNMLLKQTTAVWELVWGKDGYRNRINARLAEQERDEEETAVSFETFLLADYAHSVKELEEFVLRPLQTFKAFKTRWRIRTQDRLVQPKVFPNRHFSLQESNLSALEQFVHHVRIQPYAQL